MADQSDATARRRRRIRRGLTAAVLAAAFAMALPLAAHWAAPGPIRFHQFDIVRLDARYGDLTATDLVRTFRSMYAAGWARLVGGQRKAPDLANSPAMLDYVFSWVPSYAVAYPTEQFYYFRTKVGEREVWGNLRLGDLPKKKLMFSYFTTPISDSRSCTLEVTERDGLAVDLRAEDVYDVTWRGRTVRFVVADLGRGGPARLKMLPEEESVGHVRDESGLKFFLLYNRDTRAFYYVLDEEGGAAEEFDAAEEGLLVGRRTAFAFHADPDYGRKTLVGAALSNIEANNFYDGPGDQVPIGLDLRDRIYAAYPSAQLGGGIDSHGVMLGRPTWCRYVIGSYMPYVSIREIAERLRSVGTEHPKGRLWTAMTREWWWTPAFVEKTQMLLKAEGKTGEIPWLAVSQTK